MYECIFFVCEGIWQIHMMFRYPFQDRTKS